MVKLALFYFSNKLGFKSFCPQSSNYEEKKINYYKIKLKKKRGYPNFFKYLTLSSCVYNPPSHTHQII